MGFRRGVIMNEHDEVLDELMGISGLDDRERYKLEQDIISCIKRNQLNVMKRKKKINSNV
ncbi:hypothetical protein RM648_14260 [Mammaliicoccus sciuri]|uniref:hypothetical protein n=2 Tax=Mammaliicoccus sciuri TaxID=1296 RepID=UPI002883D089|nr:hypothetical protein [Mammaliicoccus sciuri]MDT0746415.1 hypothetical protein [Mammaliicoccus sciuri]